MTWVLFDGGEWWDESDRFGVIPCPDGWYGWDTRCRDESDTYRDVEDAKAWCQDVLDSETATPLAPGV